MVLPISAAIDALAEGVKSFTTPFIQPIFVSILYIVVQSLPLLLTVWRNGDQIQDEKEFTKNPMNARTFDFIIVGAGSAGCLIANRLSRHYNVLLLEAGGEPNPIQFIPGFGLFLTNRPQIDWQHRSVPQKYGTLISVNAEAAISAGIGLGGTGNLNLMMHYRGHKRDYDAWSSITGDPSWSWEGVLPYYKSYEDYDIPGDDVNHGYRGDLRIESPDYIGNAREFVKAGLEMGYPNVDLNAPFNEGFDIITYPIKKGVRQAPYKAFLEPIRKRRTLTIMKFAQVNKILFRNGNTAYGVEFDRHGKTLVAHARREVIISAGAIGSPKILMLSGIGPRDHLESLNIPVLSDLPVGENFQDHLGVYLGPFFIRPGLGTVFERDLTPSQFVKWFTLGKGRLTSTGLEGSGIVASDLAKAKGEGDWPDLHLISVSYSDFRYGAEVLADGFNLKLDEMQKYFVNTEGRDAAWVCISGARPVSRGFIKLASNSAYDKLIIEPNYLSDHGDNDLKVLLDGVKKSLYLMENTTAGALNMGARLNPNVLPGCEGHVYRSDAYWECYIRRLSVTLHHFGGTVSMGSVVDSELRVKGVRHLRVIDASVQPLVVVTNTQGPTLMIAEKGSHLVLDYWNQQIPVQKPMKKKWSIIQPILDLFKGHKDKGPFFWNDKNGKDQSGDGKSWQYKKKGFEIWQGSSQANSTANVPTSYRGLVPATPVAPLPSPPKVVLKKPLKQNRPQMEEDDNVEDNEDTEIIYQRPQRPEIVSSTAKPAVTEKSPIAPTSINIKSSEENEAEKEVEADYQYPDNGEDYEYEEITPTPTAFKKPLKSEQKKPFIKYEEDDRKAVVDTRQKEGRMSFLPERDFDDELPLEEVDGGEKTKKKNQLKKVEETISDDDDYASFDDNTNDIDN